MKFRAWDDKAQEMFYNVFFTPIYMVDGEPFVDNEIGFTCSLLKDRNQCVTLSDCSKIMQYIGLKDREDVEIYEGDILTDGYNKGIVKWFSNWIHIETDEEGDLYFPYTGFVLVLKENCLGLDKEEAEGRKVIGNKWKNPELI